MWLKRNHIPIPSSKFRNGIEKMHVVFPILGAHLDSKDVFHRVLVVVESCFVAGIKAFSRGSDGPMGGIPGISKALHLEVNSRQHGGSCGFGSKETIGLRQQRLCGTEVF